MSLHGISTLTARQCPAGTVADPTGPGPHSPRTPVARIDTSSLGVCSPRARPLVVSGRGRSRRRLTRSSSGTKTDEDRCHDPRKLVQSPGVDPNDHESGESDSSAGGKSRERKRH